jgi:hypothetical protein
MFRSIYENRQRRLQLAATKFAENRIILATILFSFFYAAPYAARVADMDTVQ